MATTKLSDAEVNFVRLVRTSMQRQGLDEDSLQSIATYEGLRALDKFMTSVAEIVNLGKDTFVIRVDYNKSLKQMIKAGKFLKGAHPARACYSQEAITEELFPVRGNGICTRTIKLFALDPGMTNEEIMDFLRNRRLRHARIEELLALAAQYKMTMTRPIVCLGSCYEPRKHSNDASYWERGTYCPCIGASRGRRRYLYLRQWLGRVPYGNAQPWLAMVKQ